MGLKNGEGWVQGFEGCSGSVEERGHVDQRGLRYYGLLLLCGGQDSASTVASINKDPSLESIYFSFS